MTLCVNAQHTVRVLGGTANCASGEQAVRVFTKAGANARFALKSQPHSLDAWEKTATCTTGSNGSGVSQLDASLCDDYDNVDLTGDTVGTSLSTYVFAGGNAWLATLTIHLTDGDVVATGYYDTEATTTHFAITGGTGAYTGAVGTINGTFENEGAAFRYSINYQNAAH